MESVTSIGGIFIIALIAIAALVGLAIGAAVLVGIVVLIVFLVKKAKKKDAPAEQKTEEVQK